MLWQPYDPSWLVELAKVQYPDHPWLAEALATCTRCAYRSKAYTYFVNPERANEAGAPWQFVINMDLDSPDHGTLILDILTEQRVGGVEFVRYIKEVA